MLGWSVENATDVQIMPGLTSIDTIGSLVMTPLRTTTYRLIAMNLDHESEETITVVVTDPQLNSSPVVSFLANNSTIEKGDSVTLSWSTSNASSVRIDNGIGNVSLDGHHQITPSETTLYTLTATRNESIVTEQLLIKVKDINPADVKSFTNSYGMGFCANRTRKLFNGIFSWLCI